MKILNILYMLIFPFYQINAILPPEMYNLNHMIYSKYDLLGKYKYSEFIELSFGIHNLFNKTYYQLILNKNIGSEVIK